MQALRADARYEEIEEREEGEEGELAAGLLKGNGLVQFRRVSCGQLGRVRARCRWWGWEGGLCGVPGNGRMFSSLSLGNWRLEVLIELWGEWGDSMVG